MKRKYYEIYVKRVPPFCPINQPYFYKEHVFAYSEDGAIQTFDRYHKDSYGNHYAMSVKEITKEEFRGHHKYILE